MGVTQRGQLHSKAWQTDNRAREIQKDIILTEPDRAPLTTMLMKLTTKPTFSDTFEHAEYTYPSPTITSVTADSNSYSSGDSAGPYTLTLDGNGSKQAMRVKSGLQLRLMRTKEILRVTNADIPNNQIYVIRGAAGTTPAALLANDVYVMASEGNEEGVTYSDAIMQEPDLQSNIVEEFETAVEMSNIEMTLEDLTEDQWNFQVQVKAAEHKEKIERMIWLGGKEKIAGPNNRWMRYSGGILYFLDGSSLTNSTHTLDLGGAILTKPFFDAWVTSSFYTFGSPNDVMLFTSPAGWTAISAIATTSETLQKDNDTLGLTIHKVVVNNRTFRVTESFAFAKWGMNSFIGAVNMSNIRLRRLQNKGYNYETQWKKNVQPNDQKGRKDVLYSIYGLQLPNFRSHGYLTNFSVPQAS